MSPELEEAIRRARIYMDSLTPEEKEAMFRRQSEGWAKSEAQWAKDFREGKCDRD